jgi:hypothetical protein
VILRRLCPGGCQTLIEPPTKRCAPCAAAYEAKRGTPAEREPARRSRTVRTTLAFSNFRIPSHHLGDGEGDAGHDTGMNPSVLGIRSSHFWGLRPSPTAKLDAWPVPAPLMIITATVFGIRCAA